MTLWWAIAALCAACYALKLAGLAAPRRVLDHPAVRRFAELVPVALLAALMVNEIFIWHDLALFVFEGCWVALGLLLLKQPAPVAAEADAEAAA